MSFGKHKKRVDLIITGDLVDEIVLEWRMTLDLTTEKIALMDAEKRVSKELASNERKARVRIVADETLRHLNNGDLSEEGILGRLARQDLKKLGFVEGESVRRGRVEGFEI